MSREENNIYDSFSSLDSDDDLIDVVKMEDTPSIADVPALMGRNPLAPPPMQPQPRPRPPFLIFPLINFPQVPDASQSGTSESLELTESYSPPASPLDLRRSGIADGDSPAPLHRADAVADFRLQPGYADDIDIPLSLSSSGDSQGQSAISPDKFRQDSPREKSPDRGRK